MNLLEQTITVERLTLGDWLAIASTKENSQNWGFYGWLENCDRDTLAQLTRKQMEEMITTQTLLSTMRS